MNHSLVYACIYNVMIHVVAFSAALLNHIKIDDFCPQLFQQVKLLPAVCESQNSNANDLNEQIQQEKMSNS